MRESVAGMPSGDQSDHPALTLTYIEELAELSVGKIGDLRVERADLDVGLLHDEFLLGEPLAVHQISVLAELRLELLCGRLGEHVKQGEHLSVLLCELLDGYKVFELGEVDHIDGFDRKDDTPARVLLRLRDVGVLLAVQFEVGEDNLEGGSRLANLIERAANFLIE